MGKFTTFLNLLDGLSLIYAHRQLPVILLYYLYDIVINYIAGKFSILNSLFEFAAPWDMFKSLIPITLLIGIGIGFFGSLITTKKHLKI